VTEGSLLLEDSRPLTVGSGDAGMRQAVRRIIHERIVARLLTINDTPRAIALGTSIGLFLALTPTVGIQVLLALVICTIVRANRLAAVALVFVSNPVTMLPIYWVDYVLGCWVSGIAPIDHATFDANWAVVWQRVSDAGMIEGVMEGARVLLGDIGRPMMIGGSLLGAILALPLYPITRRGVIAHRKRREARHAVDRLKELRAEASTDPLAEPHRPARPPSELHPEVESPGEVQLDEVH
jgi:uncharacterized protein (DUF2062 family)